ncbi:MAG TPA: helix-turn-helix transcriptional regulator [Candidatus Acidoferrales bacterium]|nr:helix-turn-helix transcriptional regulator [Candidatus Acidoferrales bacterium]
MAAKKRDTANYLPLTPAEFHFLLALAEGDKHAYAIMKDVARLTDGAVRLSAGTLYGLVRRFVGEGMIAEKTERPAAALDDERRRYYRLTDFGREVAIAEAERLEKLLALPRAKRLLARTRTA